MNGRRSDFLIIHNDEYIELDGMNRSETYWREKYEGTEIIPTILINYKMMDDWITERISERNHEERFLATNFKELYEKKDEERFLDTNLKEFYKKKGYTIEEKNFNREVK